METQTISARRFLHARTNARAYACLRVTRERRERESDRTSIYVHESRPSRAVISRRSDIPENSPLSLSLSLSFSVSLSLASSLASITRKLHAKHVRGPGTHARCGTHLSYIRTRGVIMLARSCRSYLFKRAKEPQPLTDALLLGNQPPLRDVGILMARRYRRRPRRWSRSCIAKAAAVQEPAWSSFWMLYSINQHRMYPHACAGVRVWHRRGCKRPSTPTIARWFHWNGNDHFGNRRI